MRKDCYIGIFDSGVGGTTVLKWIRKLLPKENIIYFGDNKNAPYGEKSQEDIRDLSIKAGDFLVANGCKAIVIACNTATAAAYDEMRDRYPGVPVIGVIEAGAKVALTTSRRKVGVMATTFTVKSGAYLKEVRRYNKDMGIFQVGCKELCRMIEYGWDKIEDADEVLKGYMDQIPENVDTLILGCTHYPIIREQIEKHFWGTIVDPGVETAMELKKILESKKLVNDKNGKGKVDFFVSGEREEFKEVAEKFLEINISKVYTLNF